LALQRSLVESNADSLLGHSLGLQLSTRRLSQLLVVVGQGSSPLLLHRRVGRVDSPGDFALKVGNGLLEILDWVPLVIATPDVFHSIS
jgi:hypothetical protein